MKLGKDIYWGVCHSSWELLQSNRVMLKVLSGSIDSIKEPGECACQELKIILMD